MTNIFLKDIIKKVLIRGAITGNRYYNIIIPVLSKMDYSLILLDDTEKTLHLNYDYYSLDYKGNIYTIRNGFTKYFDKDKIKHSFHKSKIKSYNNEDNTIQDVDMYTNNKNEGFENI